MGSSVPVQSTRPSNPSNATVASLRNRLELLETLVARINANRTPAPTLVHQLANAGPMSQVSDGESLIYNEATGQYEPGVPTGGYAALTGPGKTNPTGTLTFGGPLGAAFISNAHGLEIVAGGTVGQNLLIEQGGAGELELLSGTGGIFATTSGLIQLTSTGVGTGGGAVFNIGPGAGFGFDVICLSSPIGLVVENSSGLDVLGSIEINAAGAISLGNYLATTQDIDIVAGGNVKLIPGGGGGGFGVTVGGGGAMIGFFNNTPINKPNVTGSRGGNAALASLLTALGSSPSGLGLIGDSTTP